MSRPVQNYTQVRSHAKKNLKNNHGVRIRNEFYNVTDWRVLPY